MDYDGSTDEDADNEENWQDTNWDADVSSSGPCKPAVSVASVYTKDCADRKELSTTESSDGQSSVPLMTRMQLNDHKAGMQGLDKEHINQIIYDASKGSRFFENERLKEEQVNLRIQEQEKNKNNMTEAELQRGLAEADDLVAQLEESRDLSQKIVHVDMDAFYAAVEMRDDPSLRNKPMAVGGIGMLISGIGRVTEQLLRALGVTTCGDLYQQRALLYLLYSSVSFSYFMRVTCGIGSVHVARDEERKSMSTERTFRELSRPEEQYSKCLDLCHNLATDLADEQLMGKTISLKLKTTDFKVRTRAQTISNYTNDANAIFAVAKGILRAEIQAELPDPLRLRLMGVRVSKLAPVSECHQEKQNTIKGFLSKMNSASNPPGSPSTTDVKISTSLDDAVAPAAESSDVAPAGSNGALVGSDVALVTPSAITGFPSVTDSHLHDICVKHNTEEESSEYGFPKTSTNSEKDINENCKDSLMYKEKTTQALSDEVDLLKSTARSRIVSADLDAASLSEPTGSDVAKLTGDFITDKQLDTGSLARSSASSDLNIIPSSSVSGEVDAASDWQLTTHDDPSIETSRQDDTAHLFVREPSYTCPVCCKDVSCINLTDFNAHIDRCLDGGQKQCQRKPAADKSKSKKHNSNTSAGSSVKKSKKSQMHDAKSPQTSKAAEISRKKSHSPSIASKSQSQQQTHTVKEMHYANPEETTRFNHHMLAATGTVYSMDKGDKPSTSDAGSNTTHSLVQESTGLAKRDLSLHDCGGERKSVCEVSHDLEGLDYMVCPLCGAERADWTLKSFNQHVDTCLNRDTISQILREQKSEQKSKKRHAGSSLEDRVSSQQSVKRPKKSSSPKPGCSILSFFKN